MTREANYSITPGQARLRCYSRALKDELLFQSESTEEELLKNPINHPKILAYKGQILGGRSHVRHYADWTDFLFNEYGPKKSCLSLGPGTGRVERYLIKIGFACHFDTIGLGCNVTLKKEAAVSASMGDLNFAELRADSYDFILCHGILHHLINLENIFEQINSAVKADGLILIYEYVGANRYQFSPEHLSHLRSILPDITLSNIPISSVFGFEAVRSADIMELIRAVFRGSCERSVEYGGVLFPLVVCSWPDASQHIDRILRLDTEISKRAELPPCYHMGVYRKSHGVVPRANPLTDKELRLMLSPPVRLYERLSRSKHRLRRILSLRTRFRSLLSMFSRV